MWNYHTLLSQTTLTLLRFMPLHISTVLSFSLEYLLQAVLQTQDVNPGAAY